MVLKSILAVLIVLAISIGLFIFIARKRSSVVVVTRTFNAPAHQIWKLWNDPESMKKWWSPKNFTAPIIQNDPRVGGAFLLSMKDPNGKMFWNAGHYTEVIPEKKMVSRLFFSDEHGKKVPPSTYSIPGEWPDEVTVSVLFEEVGNATKVTVREEGIPLIMYVFAKMGWEQQFDKFDLLVTNQIK